MEKNIPSILALASTLALFPAQPALPALPAQSALPLAAVSTPQSLKRDFVTPPDTARPWVFWFWSDGNITREGITADLEAMKRAGIGGVLIMEVDQGVPKGTVRIMTPEWRRMFVFAASEAARLGLQIIMNNDPGWTGSGGPWNTPENSMQKVVWTEERVRGPAQFDGALKQPETIAGFYRDIAVLAVPTPLAEARTMRDHKPALASNAAAPGALAALIDGDKKTGVTLARPDGHGEWPRVQFDFPAPFEAGSFEVAVTFAKPGGAARRVLCELHASDDGRDFREVARVQANAPAQSFAPVKAKIFRVTLSGNDASLAGLRVDEITLASALRIDDFARKSGLGLASSPEETPASGEGLSVSKERILDLTPSFRDGRLRWRAPEGEWTILRLGHTSTGKTNYPAPEDACGLEVDKLSATALDAHFDAMLGKLVADTEAAGVGAGTLVGFHIDSWEVGYQNWTPRFRAEFERLRGYDPVPWMPALTGRAVGSAELSERFLWDTRRTISDLLNENYAGRMAALARERGRFFSLEGYRNGPFDPLEYTGRADLPVGEFWVSPDPDNLHPSVKTMTSAGHIHGKNIISAEAFTATDYQSRHQLHPYAAKSVGDAAFCAGINHFIVHRYSLQPWTDDRQPGMTMGPWGWEYERTATWWEQSRPWHEYLTRCQLMLQQGGFVADVCYLQDEEGIKNPPLCHEVLPAPPEGFDYDLCSGEVVLTRMSVKDGRLVLPGGMSYRVLVMPQQRLMRPALLRKIRDLVRDGATVLGEPPLRAPGLSGYPTCDAEVRSLAAEIWGDWDGERVKERRLGRGRVLRGVPVLDALAPTGPDFAYSNSGNNDGGSPRVRYIHRSTPDREIYFVANIDATCADITATFRVEGGRPELWRPETGAIEAAPMFHYEKEKGNTRARLPLRLGPRESVFVVFPKNTSTANASAPAAFASMKWIQTEDAKTVPACKSSREAAGAPRENARPPQNAERTFTLAAWVKPAVDMDIPPEDFAGTSALHVTRNDLLYPPQGVETFRDPAAAGTGIAVGRNVVCVLEHSAFHFPATLVHPVSITDWTHLAVVFRDGRPSLYVNGRLVRTGLKSLWNARGCIPEARNAAAVEFKGDYSVPQLFDRALDEAEIQKLMRATPARPAKTNPEKREIADAKNTCATNSPWPLPPFEITIDSQGAPAVWCSQGGRCELARADGSLLVFESGTVPDPIALGGPWTLGFPAGCGAPPSIELPRLISLSEHVEPGVRYFSGGATYSKTFDIPTGLRGAERRLWLDLGDVREIARVRLNGRDLGILWKPPFRMDITGVLRNGPNTFEITVTNTWVNRLIGDEQLPPDREWVRVPRRRGFAMKEYPAWFLRGERSPVGRITFTTWKHYEKDAPLSPSGLLGPVFIRTFVKASPSPAR